MPQNWWKHKIVDDFLDKEDFEFAEQTLEKIIVQGSFQKYLAPNKFTTLPESKVITTEKTIEKQKSVGVTSERMLEFQKKYEQKLMDILKELAPERVKDVEYMEISFSASVPGYKHFPHLDRPQKLLSVVVYISPEKNVGTVMYLAKPGKSIKKGGSGKNLLGRRVVPWKPNRAFIFARSSETWHSWVASPNQKPRGTLLFNLKTDKKSFEDQGDKMMKDSDYEKEG